MLSLLRALSPLALISVGAVAACGAGAVPPDDLEHTVSTKLKEQIGVAPKRVDCPDGLDAKVGAKVTCVLTAPNGDRYDVALTAKQVKGTDVNFDFKVADQPK